MQKLKKNLTKVSIQLSTIGEYKLCKQIGQGKTAKIYLAKFQDGKFDVLKVMKPNNNNFNKIDMKNENHIMS